MNLLKNWIKGDSMVRIDKDNDTTRSILLFAGGFVAGFALKMAIESDMFKELKDNALDMVDNYFNNKIEYVDIDIDDSDVDSEIDSVDSDVEIVDSDVVVSEVDSVDSDVESEDVKKKVDVKIE